MSAPGPDWRTDPPWLVPLALIFLGLGLAVLAVVGLPAIPS